MSLRFPSAITRRSFVFAYAQTSQNTFIPSHPRSSKYAICGFTQQAVSFTASMMPWQNSKTPAASCGIPSGSFSISGSSPTHTGDFSFTAAVSASPKCIGGILAQRIDPWNESFQESLPSLFLRGIQAVDQFHLLFGHGDVVPPCVEFQS